MADTEIVDPATIRQLRAQGPAMRERDFARIHKISEAALVAAHVGQGVTRLTLDVEATLKGLPAVGEVMALTRNESAVHEKIGTYGGVSVGAQTGLVIGDEIDLRVFPPKWKHAFAVEKAETDAPVRRSLQFFDAAGDAVHKVHLREESDLAAYEALVSGLAAADQSPALLPSAPLGKSAKGPAGTAEELSQSWRGLTDTHQFHGMLKRLNLERLDALWMIDDDFAWPLETASTARLFHEAAASALPIMAFVGNPGCIQIHSGPITSVQPIGPWLNVMDENFHLHLRLDQIAELWAVRKPAKNGHVTSVEAYAADRSLIIQFFGEREEGRDERVAWRRIAEDLPRRPRSTAA